MPTTAPALNLNELRSLEKTLARLPKRAALAFEGATIKRDAAGYTVQPVAGGASRFYPDPASAAAVALSLATPAPAMPDWSLLAGAPQQFLDQNLLARNLTGDIQDWMRQAGGWEIPAVTPRLHHRAFTLHAKAAQKFRARLASKYTTASERAHLKALLRFSIEAMRWHGRLSKSYGPAF